MAEYNSGPMPGTDLTYEDFEGFLASFHLTLSCLESSGRTSDPQDYAAVTEILNGFAERYRVQPPLQAAHKPRSRKASAKPRQFTNDEMVFMVNSFGQDFGVGRVFPGNRCDLDASERLRLGRILLSLLDRYALADIVYANEGGERVPKRIKRWLAEDKRHQRLAESVRQWRSWQV